MNIVETASEELARPHDTLALRVRYLASPKPYVEPRAALTETLATLKPKVLHFFGLVEGDAPHDFSFMRAAPRNTGARSRRR
jgi:hypothetical protein